MFMQEYYALRAPVYDHVYAKPERQSDLDEMEKWLVETVANRNILEIACGTGYWTEAMAATATKLLATDVNESMLEIARQKDYPRKNVQFECLDMYDMKPMQPFDTLFGGFIWSHIALEELDRWLDHLHRLLPKGSMVIFLDNNFIEGSSSPIAHTDARGNQFQDRALPDGQTFRIVKNFPDRNTFEQLLKNQTKELQVIDFQYYWAIKYITA